MYTKRFWISASERALRTVAQAMLSMITISGFNMFDANWLSIMTTSLLAGFISLLMSMVASSSNKDDSASFVETSMKG